MDAAFQRRFVQLVTDDAARAAFLADPAGAVADLAPRAAAALVDLEPQALVRYAESLKAKRWRGLAAIVPLTRRASPGLGARYRRWLGRHPCPGDTPGLAPGESEGLRCLPDLRRALAADPGEAEWIGDVFAYEVLRACSHRDGTPRHLRSRFKLPEIVEILRAGSLPFDVEAAPTELRFERHRLRWRAR